MGVEDIISSKLKEDLEKCSNYEEIMEKDLVNRLNNLHILSRGKYLIASLIKYILEDNQYLEEIFNTDRYMDEKYIANTIVAHWIKKIILKFIAPIYDEQYKLTKRSDSAFLLDKKTFFYVKRKIEDMVYDEDFDLKEEFKIIF